MFSQDDVRPSTAPLLDLVDNPPYLGLRAPVPFVDFDLPHSNRKIKTNDDLEGDLYQLSRLVCCSLMNMKSKLATARNANPESDVDDSMLNLGLFSYPVLQAADILIYRSAVLLLLNSSSCENTEPLMSLWAKTKCNI